MAKIELVWPNGDVTTGSTWTEVEAAIRAAQPRPYKTRREFRRALRRRAWLWSGRRPGPYPPWSSRAFIENLAEASMFIIYQKEE